MRRRCRRSRSLASTPRLDGRHSRRGGGDPPPPGHRGRPRDPGRGGNAADAAVAANAVQGMVDPTTCGPGGDLFALVHRPGEAAPEALNASGRGGSGLDAAALRAAGHDRFPLRSPQAVTAPGCVDGWLALAGRHGTRPLSALLAPAIRLGEEGLPRLRRPRRRPGAAAPDRSPGKPRHPSCTRRAAAPGRARRSAGRAWRRPCGPSPPKDATPSTAARVGAAVTAATGGALTAADLARPHADWVEPIGIDIFAHRLWTIPPNSQGYLTGAAAWLLEQFAPPPDPEIARLPPRRDRVLPGRGRRRGPPGGRSRLPPGCRPPASSTPTAAPPPRHPPPRPRRPAPARPAARRGHGLPDRAGRRRHGGLADPIQLHRHRQRPLRRRHRRLAAQPGSVLLAWSRATPTRPPRESGPATPSPRPSGPRTGASPSSWGPAAATSSRSTCSRWPPCSSWPGWDPASAQAQPRWHIDEAAADGGSVLVAESRMPEDLVAGLRRLGHSVAAGPALSPGWGPVSVIAAAADGTRIAAADPRVATAQAAAH